MTRLFFGSVLLISLIAAACGSTPRRSRDNDDEDDGDGGESSAYASASSGGSTPSAACKEICGKVAPICPADDDAACLSQCAMYETGSCSAEWNVLNQCSLKPEVMYTCEDGKPNGGDTCFNEAVTMAGCLQNSGAGGAGGEGGGGGGGVGGGGVGGGGSAGECYADHGPCNPLTNSCAAGEACDLESTTAFGCFPPPNDTPIGAACTSSGPYCQHGSTCYQGMCRAYCCSSTDCGAGTCKPVELLPGLTFQANLCLP